MPWSRLKTRWRTLLAPSLASRVDVHVTSYDRGAGRAWLTVDGRDVASFCEFAYAYAMRQESRRQGNTGWPYTDEAEAVIRAAGKRHKGDLMNAMGTCIGNPVERLLESPEYLVRALAMLDRRLGKRRLARLDATGEHPLVTRMHQLRCEAEGIRQEARRAG